MTITRLDGRTAAELRPTRMTAAFTMHAEGSVLIEAGRTRVICTASVEERVPPFLRNTGKGWVTAEYGMLPRATSTRTQREATTSHPGGTVNELLTIYTIVNALTVNLPAVNAVQVLVDGKEVDTLSGHVDLPRPLAKNLAWVQ